MARWSGDRGRFEYKDYRFEYKFPEGEKIHYWDLGLKEKDIERGFLTDIDLDTKPPFTREHLVSLGHGLDTTIIKHDDE